MSITGTSLQLCKRGGRRGGTDLEVRPGGLQRRVVLVRVKLQRVVVGRERTEGVGPHQPHDGRIDGLRERVLEGGDVVEDLIEGGSLDLLGTKVAHGVGKVKDVAALLYLAEEEVCALLLWSVCKESVCASTCVIDYP